MLTTKRTDNYDAITWQCEDENGKRVDLTGSTVNFIMGKKNKVITNAPAQITSAIDGIVSYQLKDTDTLVSGQFLGEFEVIFANGMRKHFPSNGYITVNISDNIDTNNVNVVVDMIAAKQGDFEKKLNDILKMSSTPNISYMNEYYWTTTEGQTTFVLPDGYTLNTDSKWVDVFIGNVLVDKSLVDVSVQNRITILVDSSMVSAGLKVYVKWTDSVTPLSYNVIDGGTF